MDNIQRLESLQKKAKEFDTKKIGAEKELELLRKEYEGLIIELQTLGVENIDDLPSLITQLEQDLNQELTQAEKHVGEIEKFLSSI